MDKDLEELFDALYEKCELCKKSKKSVERVFVYSYRDDFDINICYDCYKSSNYNYLTTGHSYENKSPERSNDD